MPNKELLNELLTKDKDEVKNIFLNYIKETKQYSEFIQLIINISTCQQEELSAKLTKTKMVSNAIQVYLNDNNVKIDKSNWFVWMRYLDMTEDETTATINVVQPEWILKKIEKVFSQGNVKFGYEYKYLFERFQQLKEQYKI